MPHEMGAHWQAHLIIAAIALLASAALATAQKGCDGYPAGAKYRYEWFYQLTNTNDTKLMDSLVTKWMQQDCPGALAFGHGGALTTDPAQFGLSAASSSAQFADYAGWSDWASLDDLRRCRENGMASGNIQAIRNHAKQPSGLSRLVIALKPGSGDTTQKCTTGSNAPATVRFMLAYVLPKQETCKQAVTLHNVIVDTTGLDVRHGTDCDVIADDSQVFGSNVTKSADFGGYIDFKSIADMAKYLTNKHPIRAQLRALAASSVRTVIALPAKAYTHVQPAAAAAKKAGL